MSSSFKIIIVLHHLLLIHIQKPSCVPSKPLIAMLCLIFLSYVTVFTVQIEAKHLRWDEIQENPRYKIEMSLGNNAKKSFHDNFDDYRGTDSFFPQRPHYPQGYLGDNNRSQFHSHLSDAEKLKLALKMLLNALSHYSKSDEYRRQQQHPFKNPFKNHRPQKQDSDLSVALWHELQRNRYAPSHHTHAVEVTLNSDQSTPSHHREYYDHPNYPKYQWDPNRPDHSRRPQQPRYSMDDKLKKTVLLELIVKLKVMEHKLNEKARRKRQRRLTKNADDEEDDEYAPSNEQHSSDSSFLQKTIPSTPSITLQIGNLGNEEKKTTVTNVPNKVPKNKETTKPQKVLPEEKPSKPVNKTDNTAPAKKKIKKTAKEASTPKSKSKNKSKAKRKEAMTTEGNDDDDEITKSDIDDNDNDEEEDEEAPKKKSKKDKDEEEKEKEKEKEEEISEEEEKK